MREEFSGLTRRWSAFINLHGLSLILSGAFAFFLSVTGQFLPHDVQFLGMSAEQLCAIQGCRIVIYVS